MDTPDLFSLSEAQAARDAAIAQADEHADAKWKEVAWEAVIACAAVACEFTTDSVWKYLSLYHPNVHTHEPRALGAVMKRAQKAGWIEPTDRFVNSSRKSCHSAPIRVWRAVDCDVCETVAQ